MTTEEAPQFGLEHTEQVAEKFTWQISPAQPREFIHPKGISAGDTINLSQHVSAPPSLINRIKEKSDIPYSMEALPKLISDILTKAAQSYKTSSHDWKGIKIGDLMDERRTIMSDEPIPPPFAIYPNTDALISSTLRTLPHGTRTLINTTGYPIISWYEQGLLSDDDPKNLVLLEGNLTEAIEFGARLPDDIDLVYIDYPSTFPHDNLTLGELLRFFKVNSDKKIILDQANFGYHHTELSGELNSGFTFTGVLRRFPNLTVTHSTTKLFGQRAAALLFTGSPDLFPPPPSSKPIKSELLVKDWEPQVRRMFTYKPEEHTTYISGDIKDEDLKKLHSHWQHYKDFEEYRLAVTFNRHDLWMIFNEDQGFGGGQDSILIDGYAAKGGHFILNPEAFFRYGHEKFAGITDPTHAFIQLLKKRKINVKTCQYYAPKGYKFRLPDNTELPAEEAVYLAVPADPAEFEELLATLREVHPTLGPSLNSYHTQIEK